MDKKTEIIESLSSHERQILAFLNEKLHEICKKSGLEEVAVLRALQYLGNKGIVNVKITPIKTIELGENGRTYKHKGLPERRLAKIVLEKGPMNINEAVKASALADDEFKAALGALKKKALLELKDGKLKFLGKKEDLAGKSLEEKLIDSLPIELEKLAPEQKYALEQLKNRKNIVEISSKNNVSIEITALGKEIIKAAGSMKGKEEMIEALNQEVIASGEWKTKKFRRYDVASAVPKISGGKRHFVNQATDYARKIWTELGFKEMSGNLCQTGFWNFDALFTAQDHPVREMQDTFYIKDTKGKLPADKKLVEAVKEAHEKGVAGSSGWGGKWSEEEAKRVVLRTHTTSLSAQTLAMLGKLKNLKEKSGKFFAVGKCFRNETIDWGHSIDFNQTEGIVIDSNANFRNLLGYLSEFYKKMGYPEVKFVPSYFPYTEPSVEIYGYNTIKKVWIELGGAGIFRPEVVVPLLGEYIPVLAWGPGVDRALMEYYAIKDIRELYENDLTKLREMKFWGE